MRVIILLNILLVVVSCNQVSSDSSEQLNNVITEDHQPNPKAKEYNDQALEFLLSNDMNILRVDSAIALLDKATELDSLYFLAYSNKIHFLMTKRDFPRLLQTNAELIKLRPEQPSWLIQRGLILELSGDIEKAKTIYTKGIKEYESSLNSDIGSSWEYKLEYAQSLEMANEHNQARKIILKLKKEYPTQSKQNLFKLDAKEDLLKMLAK